MSNTTFIAFAMLIAVAVGCSTAVVSALERRRRRRSAARKSAAAEDRVVTFTRSSPGEEWGLVWKTCSKGVLFVSTAGGRESPAQAKLAPYAYDVDGKYPGGYWYVPMREGALRATLQEEALALTLAFRYATSRVRPYKPRVEDHNNVVDAQEISSSSASTDDDEACSFNSRAQRADPPAESFGPAQHIQPIILSPNTMPLSYPEDLYHNPGPSSVCDDDIFSDPEGECGTLPSPAAHPIEQANSPRPINSHQHSPAGDGIVREPPAAAAVEARGGGNGGGGGACEAGARSASSSSLPAAGGGAKKRVTFADLKQLVKKAPAKNTVSSFGFVMDTEQREASLREVQLFPEFPALLESCGITDSMRELFAGQIPEDELEAAIAEVLTPEVQQVIIDAAIELGLYHFDNLCGVSIKVEEFA
ncbi:hypothetical protein DIPPA_24480 [Diplonema papillatum]|nr:hypothetical protein DIPPA_24480 [Diplonema papillatum]